MSDFRDMISSLKAYGEVSENIPRTKRGDASKFVGEFRSKIGNQDMQMGILHYNWKRKVGVNKINQAIAYVHDTHLDGAVIVGSQFSKSAFEQADRINKIDAKKVLLFETGI